MPVRQSPYAKIEATTRLLSVDRGNALSDFRVMVRQGAGPDIESGIEAFQNRGFREGYVPASVWYITARRSGRREWRGTPPV
jgi:hypothetical protein